MNKTELQNEMVCVNSYGLHKAQGLTNANIDIVLNDGMTEIEKIRLILLGIDYSYSLDPRLNINRNKVFNDYFNNNQIEDKDNFFKSMIAIELAENTIERFIFVLMYHREAIDKTCLNYKLQNSLTSKTKTKTNKI